MVCNVLICVITLWYYYAGIFVRMEEVDYTVEEGQTAEVCVMIEGNSSIMISVDVSTDDITAEGQESILSV